MSKLTVSVTPTDIAAGREYAQFADQCPMARALNREHPRPWRWLVKAGVILRWPGRAVPMPPAAVEFNRTLLAGEPVAPLTFELEVAE